MKEVIHLRHQDKDKRWRNNTDKQKKDWYALYGRRMTQCWFNANSKPSIKITDDILRVTCKKCLRRRNK